MDSRWLTIKRNSFDKPNEQSFYPLPSSFLRVFARVRVICGKNQSTEDTEDTAVCGRDTHFSSRAAQCGNLTPHSSLLTPLSAFIQPKPQRTLIL